MTKLGIPINLQPWKVWLDSGVPLSEVKARVVSRYLGYKSVYPGPNLISMTDGI